MLHTLSHSFHQIDVEQFLASIDTNDVVLLWQDGVISALENTKIIEQLIAKSLQVYVLDNDIIARGLTKQIDSRVQIINMQECVALTAQYFPQIAW